MSDQPPQSSKIGLQLSGVAVRRAEKWILREINWQVSRGSFAAILGPNGCGKSTLARVLCGYIWPTEGSVVVEGHRFGETDLNALRHSIRLVQAAGPYDVDPELTAREVILTGLFGTIGLFDPVSPEQIRQADELLVRIGLAGLADHRYATLSSGERVRALIARALIIRPRLLILDEPTAGLDLLARERVLASVESLIQTSADAPTILMITHHIEELSPRTSQVLLLSEGRIAASGSMAQVLKPEVLTPVYKVPLTVTVDAGRYYPRVSAGAWDTLLR